MICDMNETVNDRRLKLVGHRIIFRITRLNLSNKDIYIFIFITSTGIKIMNKLNQDTLHFVLKYLVRHSTLG